MIMLETIKKIFWVSRPISWLNTAYPFAAGYIISGGESIPLLLIATLYFLIPYNILLYGINDVFDYESDIKNPRKGGIEGMREQKEFHPTIIRYAILLNIPFLVYLFVVGSAMSNIVLAIVIFSVLAYSIAKLRFKERPLIDSITSSAHFVGPLVFALSVVQFESSQLAIIVAFFLWGMASHAFGAIQDIIPDRAGHLSSIATVLGARKTVWFSLVLYIAAIIIMLTHGIAGMIVGVAGLVYPLILLPYLRVNDHTSAQTNKAWRQFIWLNLFTGFVVTIVLIISQLE